MTIDKSGTTGKMREGEGEGGGDIDKLGQQIRVVIATIWIARRVCLFVCVVQRKGRFERSAIKQARRIWGGVDWLATQHATPKLCSKQVGRQADRQAGRQAGRQGGRGADVDVGSADKIERVKKLLCIEGGGSL